MESHENNSKIIQDMKNDNEYKTKGRKTIRERPILYEETPKKENPKKEEKLIEANLNDKINNMNNDIFDYSFGNAFSKDNNIKKNGNNSTKKSNHGITVKKFVLENVENIKNEQFHDKDFIKELEDIDILHADFVQLYEQFSKNNNIRISINGDVLLPEEKQFILSEVDFWIKAINYIFKKNKNLTLYNFITFIEKSFIFLKNNNNIDELNHYKQVMEGQINNFFTKEKIADFLLDNRLKNIRDIFSKYHNPSKATYKEVKLDGNITKIFTQSKTNIDSAPSMKLFICSKYYDDKIENYFKVLNKISSVGIKITDKDKKEQLNLIQKFISDYFILGDIDDRKSRSTKKTKKSIYRSSAKKRRTKSSAKKYKK